MPSPVKKHWTKLQKGDIVRIYWDDHFNFSEHHPDPTQPCKQISTGTVWKVTDHVVVLDYDVYEREPERHTGGTIIASCITKALIYGRDSAK